LRGWVAKDVMGWEVGKGAGDLPAHVITDKGEHMYLLPDLGPQWYPDHDIAAAWEVVEKLRQEFYVDIGVDIHGAQVQLNKYYDPNWTVEVESIRADTFQLAVCRAALKASRKEN
jgi:hypothetical protein